MGWNPTDESVSLARSGTESDRFGHRVDRLNIGAGWERAFDRPSLVERIDELVGSTDARTIIVRYPARDAFIARGLGRSGRQVHPAGSLIYWESPTDDSSRGLLVRDLDDAYVAEALAVIADSFSGYVNHYHANPLIDVADVTAGYLEWAQSTIDGEHARVFTIADGGSLAGVATVDTAQDPWDVLLAGMATAAQGRGLYLELVRGVLGAAAESGVARVVISTQSHNIAVQRAWARLGFVPLAAIDTVHLVGAE